MNRAHTIFLAGVSALAISGHAEAASRGELYVILPLITFLIFLLLFGLYSNFKFPLITVAAFYCLRRFGEF